MMTLLPPCYSCKHFVPAGGNWHCDAFPAEIPEDILHGLDNHTSPYVGDNGIQYEKEPDDKKWFKGGADTPTQKFDVETGTIGGKKSFQSKALALDVKAAMWKRFDKSTTALQPLFVKAIVPVFQAQCKEVIANLEQEGIKVKSNTAGWGRQKIRTWLANHKDKVHTINFDKAAWVEKTIKALTPAYDIALETGGLARMQELSNEKAKLKFDVEFGSTAKWKGSKLREVSKSVTGTTFDQAESILREGFEESASLGEISSRLRESFDQSEEGRANNIARTESTRTYNRGDIEGVRQMKLDSVLNKFWINEPDARDTHIEAGITYSEDGAIPIDEPFAVGADKMDVPGDGDLPEETCNCRCTVGYTKADAAAGDNGDTEDTSDEE